MGVEGDRTRESRWELLENLNEVIEVALVKYAKQRASNRDRQAWGRLVVAAVGEFGKILRDVDLDEIRSRLERLEAGRG